MMSNIIDGINNPDNESCDTFLTITDDETSGCKLVETLEKIYAILRLESRQITKINSDVETKLRNFNELSNSITSKLQSLMTLSELRFGDKDEIKEFVEQMTLSWLHTNKQVSKEHSRIRVASRTSIGTPLSILLEKKKKEAAAIKVSLQIGSVIYDQDYVARGYRIYDEILQLLESLEECDDKVQRYMVMSKTTPHLVELSSTINRFVANTDLLPSSTLRLNNSTEDLSVFRIVSKLLTGELFGYKPTNPRQILTENAPRKPVFITLNTKRKIEIPRSSKISRSTLYASTHRSNYTQL